MKDEELLKESILTQDQSLVEQVGAQSKAGFKKRYFGSLREGSLRGAIFALIASAMGTGIFNLPLRVKEIGVVPFVVFIIAAASFSIVGMILMIGLIKKKKYSSYSQMSLESWGTAFMRVAQFCIIVYPWGITICFQVILSRFLCQILNDNFGFLIYEEGSNDTILTETGNIYRILINVGAIVLALLLGMKKDIQILQKISIVGVAFVVFNVACIVFTAVAGFTRQDDVYYPYRGILHVDWSKVYWGSIGSWQQISYMLQGLAALIFCFVNHQLLFPLTGKLKRPSNKRFAKIIYRSHFVEFVSYASIGILAYLLLLENIERHPISSMVIASIPVPAITIGKGLMVISLFFAVPLNTYPARESIFQAFKMERNTKNHIILTVALMCSSCLLAITFQGVNSYFGLLGGTTGVLMAAGIPAACYYKQTQKLNSKQIFMLAFVGVVTLMCFFGAILSLIQPPSD